MVDLLGLDNLSDFLDWGDSIGIAVAHGIAIGVDSQYSGFFQSESIESKSFPKQTILYEIVLGTTLYVIISIKQ